LSGLGPVFAWAGYAGLLWLIALALDAIGRRSLRPRQAQVDEEVTMGSDVARFHRVIGGAVLGAGAFMLAAYAFARRDPPALLLVPVAVTCFTGAARRIAPLWRDP
jgi:ABC-type Fe3+-siderophore transport system permease subunit